LQTWREFDLNCKHLDQLFNLNNPDSLTNLEYRSLVIEMSACLSKLKEHHGTLTSIVPERKYFEMKDLIILYELKLKKFKEDYEAKNVITQSVHNTTSDMVASTEDISNDDIYLKLNVSNTNNKANKQRVNDLKSNSNLLSEEKFIIKTPIQILNNNQEINGFRLYENERSDNVPSYNQNKQHKIYINQKTSSFSANRLNPRTNEFYKNPSPYSDCEHHDFFDNATPEVSPKKKIETSDKSTATINDMATQTDEVSSRNAADSSALPVINEKTIKTQSTSNYFNNQINEHRYNSVVDRTYLKKSKFSKHNRESDGKKLLLEAYLRNNENLTNGGSTTSSGKAASSTLSVLHANKKVSSLIKNGAKNTHESGIGTTNDDEVDSLQSIQNEYDYISELKHAEENEQTNSEKENESYYDTDLFANFKPSEINNNNNIINKINNSDVENENSDTNLIRRNDFNAKKEKILKKKVKQKLQNKQQTANDETFSRANSSNFIKQTTHFPSSYEKESSTKLRDAIIPNESDVRGQLTRNCFKSSKPKSQEEVIEEDEEAATSYYTLSWFLKRIFAIIFYVFPLGIVFLLVIYYFFVYYLNPSCCDYQRNYLVWNII
jgi:hypothetical protein